MDQKQINFLNKLELQGFKSFASKTVFEFPERVTCIVGPNGSGKSNIIDAIRWVLGERESKNLRGEGIENLIFSGTPKKAAAGVARVDLCFNNKEKKFPLDAEEIVLSRKADRSGTSTVFLNDTEIKLKDLIPLLAKIRLGSRGITIIGQGQSDIFVMSSPKERREMIEEILGLKEFRIKKSQAEKRLESSLINIDKIKATLEELAPQVRVFKKQKARLEKKAELEKELKELEGNYFAFQYQNLQKALEENEEPLSDLLSRKKILQKEVKKEEEELSEFYKRDLYDELEKIKEKINFLWQEKFNKEKEIFKLETREELESKQVLIDENKWREAFSYVEEKIREALSLNEIAAIKSILRATLEKLELLYKKQEKEEGRGKISLQKEELKREIDNLEKSLKELKEKEKELEQKTKNENLVFKEKVEILNSKKNELYKLENKIQEIELHKESISLKINDLVDDWCSLGREKEELDNFTVNSEVINSSVLHNVEARIMRLKAELLAIGEIDQSVFKEFENAEQKFTFLSNQLEDLERAAADLKVLIRNLDEQIKKDFKTSFKEISLAFDNYFKLMFGGGKARLVLEERKQILSEAQEVEIEESGEKIESGEEELGVEMEIVLPRKKIKSINMLSGGEKTLVSLAALFALISISPPPFLVLDEIDAALDEENARRFAELIKQFSLKTQFIIVTHNRATMEVADVLYGITMGDDGASKVISLKLE